MEVTKLRGINGSARRGGNSRIMMDKSIEFAPDTASGTALGEIDETGGRTDKPGE